MRHAISCALAHVMDMLQCLNGVQGELLNHARSKNTFFFYWTFPTSDLIKNTQQHDIMKFSPRCYKRGCQGDV